MANDKRIEGTSKIIKTLCLLFGLKEMYTPAVEEITSNKILCLCVREDSEAELNSAMNLLLETKDSVYISSDIPCIADTLLAYIEHVSTHFTSIVEILSEDEYSDKLKKVIPEPLYEIMNNLSRFNTVQETSNEPILEKYNEEMSSPESV